MLCRKLFPLFSRIFFIIFFNSYHAEIVTQEFSPQEIENKTKDSTDKLCKLIFGKNYSDTNNKQELIPDIIEVSLEEINNSYENKLFYMLKHDEINEFHCLMLLFQGFVSFVQILCFLYTVFIQLKNISSPLSILYIIMNIFIESIILYFIPKIALNMSSKSFLIIEHIILAIKSFKIITSFQQKKAGILCWIPNDQVRKIHNSIIQGFNINKSIIIYSVILSIILFQAFKLLSWALSVQREPVFPYPIYLIYYNLNKIKKIIEYKRKKSNYNVLYLKTKVPFKLEYLFFNISSSYINIALFMAEPVIKFAFLLL